MSEGKEDFKVADRRMFTENGELREGETESPSDASSTQEKEPQIPSQDQFSEEPSKETPVDFRSLVFSLATTAMLQLGLAPEPETGQVRKDISGARRTIDILTILQEKTKGNLTGEESGLLDHCLHDLKMNFLQISQKQKITL